MNTKESVYPHAHKIALKQANGRATDKPGVDTSIVRTSHVSLNIADWLTGRFSCIKGFFEGRRARAVVGVVFCIFASQAIIIRDVALVQSWFYCCLHFNFSIEGRNNYWLRVRSVEPSPTALLASPKIRTFPTPTRQSIRRHSPVPLVAFRTITFHELPVRFYFRVRRELST